MSRNLAILSVFALTFPIGINVPPDSAGTTGRVTRFSVAGGGGAYGLFVRDCSGNTLSSSSVRYREVGGLIDQQVGGPLHVGVRGGAIRERSSDSERWRETRYANPYIALEGRRAGLGVGKFIVPGAPASYYENREMAPFSGHLRLGGRAFHLSVHAMEAVPLMSGGGYGEAGMGFRPASTVDCWLGTTIGPYDKAGLAVKTAWHVHPRLTVDLNTRLGGSEGMSENGVGVALTSRLGGSSSRRSTREE